MLQKIAQAGVSPRNSSYLNDKMILSNWIGLLLIAFVGLPFSITTWFFFRPLMFLMVIAVVTVAFSIFLNYLGNLYVGRFVIATLPAGFSTVYHAYCLSANELPIHTTFALSLSLSLAPFVIFDLREKWWLVSSALLVTTGLLGLEYLNPLLEAAVDSVPLRQGALATSNILSAIVVGTGCIFILLKQNAVAEDRATILIKEARKNADIMKKKEQELTENLTQLARAGQEEQQRQWIAEGLTQTNRLIQCQDDLNLLTDPLLQFVVKYIKANQGGLFLTEEQNSETVLVLSASYAYERKKYLRKCIAVGEGLVGQAFLEKKYAYLTELPPDYVSITSGLGKATPTCLIVLPLIANEIVEGVLEIASFNTLSDYELQFLQQWSESVAASVRSMRMNQLTKRLLQESQHQAEELRAQEEELRQTMEELQVTQERVDRRQKDLDQLPVEKFDF